MTDNLLSLVTEAWDSESHHCDGCRYNIPCEDGAGRPERVCTVVSYGDNPIFCPALDDA